MPGFNPKHKKPIDQTQPMGVKKAAEKCSVESCSESGMHSMSYQNLEGYLSKVGFKVREEASKTKKVVLCKKHYKIFKKEKYKDEKLLKHKNFGDTKEYRPPKPPKEMF